jgi:hypothetical protein
MVQRHRVIGLTGIIILVFGLALQEVLVNNASALPITARSLTLQSGLTDGGSLPSGVVNHYFQFTLHSTAANSLGSIRFLYCTLPGSLSDPCTTPAGLSTTSGSITMSDTGSGITGWTLVNTIGAGAANGSPYVHLASANTPVAAVNMKIKLSGVTNPSATNTTFFVRIASYGTLDTTGPVTDSGTVAASTTNRIDLSGTMPESLVFCTGGTVAETGGVPDCSLATSGTVAFNQLFSPTSTAWAYSEMAASTNAGSGYVITAEGATMTSGLNTITAIGGTATTSNIGTRQFGMNLVTDTIPAVDYSALTWTGGTGDITPASDGVNYMAAASANFNTVNNYAFDDTALNIVAKSDNGLGGTPSPSNAQIYTASYIVNVSGNQPAGLYQTTITYICTPTF